MCPSCLYTIAVLGTCRWTVQSALTRGCQAQSGYASQVSSSRGLPHLRSKLRPNPTEPNSLDSFVCGVAGVSEAGWSDFMAVASAAPHSIPNAVSPLSVLCLGRR